MSAVPRVDRALLAIAAPSWRARYAKEFTEVLVATPAGVGRSLDIAGTTAKSWLRPSRHLHDRNSRLRATLTVHITVFLTLLTAQLSYRMVSIDGLQGDIVGSAVTLARTGRAGEVIAPLVLAVGMLPIVGSLLGRTHVRWRVAVRPIGVAAALAAGGTAVLAATPVRSRMNLGVLSWLTGPVAVVAVTGLVAGIGVHRVLTVQPLPRPVLVAAVPIVSVATIVNAYAAFMSPELRFVGPGYGDVSGWLHTFQPYLMLSAVIGTVIVLVSLSRALRAVVRYRPAIG